jgi:hypothetical protein
MSEEGGLIIFAPGTTSKHLRLCNKEATYTKPFMTGCLFFCKTFSFSSEISALAAAGTHHLRHDLRPGVLRRLVAHSCAPLLVRFLNHLYKLIISSGSLGHNLTIT